jgi:hypothetical protein
MNNIPENQRVERLLEPIAVAKWNGPDRHPVVEQCIKEKTMKRSKLSVGRTGIALIALGVFGGGALATGVTYQIMAQRATIITDDGQEFQVELVPDGQASTGSFVADDGTVYDINVLNDEGGQTQMTVDVTGDGAGGSGETTVIIGPDDD